jgi:hypothetical protein
LRVAPWRIRIRTTPPSLSPAIASSIMSTFKVEFAGVRSYYETKHRIVATVVVEANTPTNAILLATGRLEGPILETNIYRTTLVEVATRKRG